MCRQYVPGKRELSHAGGDEADGHDPERGGAVRDKPIQRKYASDKRLVDDEREQEARRE